MAQDQEESLLNWPLEDKENNIHHQRLISQNDNRNTLNKKKYDKRKPTFQ